MNQQCSTALCNLAKTYVLVEEALKELIADLLYFIGFTSRISQSKCKFEKITTMNKDLEIILSACEKPIILAPDNLPVINGNIFAVCSNLDGQGSSFPIIISSVQSESSDSSVTDSVMHNDVSVSKTEAPVLSLQQSKAPSIITEIKESEAPVGSKLSCKVCGKQFTRQENLTFHEQTHNNSNLFLCNTCSKSFSTSESLIDHLATHRVNFTDKALEKCDICGKYFHKACISEHEKKYKSQIMFYCRFCEQSFSKRGLLIYHLKLHSDDECPADDQKVNECEICLKAISQSAEEIFNNQKKRTVADENLKQETPPILERQLFQSKRRKKGRPSKKYYQMPILEPEVHQTDVNTNESISEDSQNNGAEEAIIILSDDESDNSSSSACTKQGLTLQSFSSCEICLTTFPNNKLLLDHCKEHFELQCVDCGLYFNGIHDLLQHEELLHRVQCYTCKKCDKNITLKSNFIEHILNHDVKPLQVCKVCYLYLFQKYTKYLARFTLFTGRKAFQCDICCKILQTANAENLRCYLCSDQFTSKSALKDHQEEFSLTNVKCFECNQYFHSVKGFNLHMAEFQNNCVVSHRRHLFTNKSDSNCIKCFKEFLSPEDLEDHCFDEEHYKCNNCEEKFSDWESFSSHLVLYPLMICTGCKAFVLGEKTLGKHKNVCTQMLYTSLQSATNFDYSKNLLCVDCNEVFSKKECLVEHIIFSH